MTGAMALLERLRAAAPYAFLARNSFLTALSFRWRTLLSFFAGTVQILVQYFLWQALYAHVPTFDGIGLQDMLSYLVLNTLQSAFYGMRVGSRLATSINDGSIAADLLKPLRIKLTYAAYETGGILADLCVRILPMLLVWAVFLRVKGPAAPSALAAAVLFLLLGILLHYQVEVIIGQLAFWLQETWYLRWFQRALSYLFSGSLVPLWFYPQWLRWAAEALPFRFISFVPLSLYLGKTPLSTVPALLSSALIWQLVLGLLERLVWSRGIRQIVIHGG